MKKKNLEQIRHTFLVVALVLLCVILVYAYQKNAKSAEKKTTVSADAASTANVLGESTTLTSTKQKIQDAIESIGNNLQPAANSLSQTVSGAYTNAVEKFASEDQKIEIDKAVEDTKKKIENLPEEMFEKARYEYCQQVVKDYESSESMQSK